MSTIRGGSLALDQSITISNGLNSLGVPQSVTGFVTISQAGSGLSFGSNSLSDPYYDVSMGAGNDYLALHKMPWVQTTNEVGGDTINMGTGNDTLLLDRSAVYTGVDMGDGDDVAYLHNSYAYSLNLGAGNDKAVVTADDDISRQEVEAKAAAAGNVQTLNGGGGTDILSLPEGDFTVDLGQFIGSRVTMDSNGTLPGGTFTAYSFTNNQLSQIVSFPAGMNGTVTFATQTINGATIRPQFVFQNFESIKIVCFTAGSLIDTPRGPVAVEELKEGDLVFTREGPKPVRFIARRRLDVVDLAANPKLLPVRIPAGAFGTNLPDRDVRLSPQHRVVLRSAIAQRMFGAAEVLVAVKQLIGVNGIATDAGVREVTYYHLMFDEHTTVTVSGIQAEALYPGKEALVSMTPNALAELFQIFPDYKALIDQEEAPDLTLPVLKGRHARALAARHAKVAKPLFS